MAKSFNGNQEGKKRMKVFIDSFLNRMRRMNSTPIQPICNKEEVLKRYQTVFWSVWNKQSVDNDHNWHSNILNEGYNSKTLSLHHLICLCEWLDISNTLLHFYIHIELSSFECEYISLLLISLLFQHSHLHYEQWIQDVSFPQSSFHNMKISHRGLRPSVHSGGSGASAAPPCADARIVCLMVKENGQVVWTK